MDLRLQTRKGHYIAGQRERAYPDKRDSSLSSGSYYEKRDHHKRGALGLIRHKISSHGSSDSSCSDENRGKNHIKGAGNAPIDHHTKTLECVSGHHHKSKSSSKVSEEEKNTGQANKLAYLLKKHNIDEDPILDDDYYLYLDLNENYDGVVDFLKEADNYEFDRLRKLSIIGMDKLSDNDLQHIAEMTKKGKLKSLDILYLNGGLDTDLGRLSEFLIHLLKITEKQVFIDSFQMVDDDLQALLEYSYKVKNLSIVNCELDRVGNSFSLPTEQSYNMKVLDLFWSAIRDDDHTINKSNIPKILKAIDNSKIGDNLKLVHVCKDDYPKYDFERPFDDLNHRFKLEVDTNQPKPLP